MAFDGALRNTMVDEVLSISARLLSLLYSGLVWFSLVWSGLVWSGLVWFGFEARSFTIAQVLLSGDDVLQSPLPTLHTALHDKHGRHLPVSPRRRYAPLSSLSLGVEHSSWNSLSREHIVLITAMLQSWG